MKVIYSFLLLVFVAISSCSTPQQVASTPTPSSESDDMASAPMEATDDVEEAVMADPEVTITKLASVEGITEYELEENGLRILLFPDQSKPTATVNITYKVGSRHEGYGETGMAHLLEHLVFKGTPNHPDIPSELTEHGARPNGTTWYDRTNYYETFSATEENLDWALDLEADRMVNSYIAKEDLDSEMTVVRNEFEIGENSPVGVLMERTMSTAYLWHNYGQSTIGSRADLENVPIERLQAFYRKYYQPDNAVLLVAGKIDVDETLELIKEKFGKIPRPDREAMPLYNTYTREPVQDGERFAELRRVGDVQVVQVLYHVPAAAHPDFPVVEVIGELLTSEPGGRLYKALVDEGLATTVWSFPAALAEPGFILFNVEVLKEGDLAAAEVALKKTLDELAENPPSEEEVKRAKDRLLKNIELNLRSSERVGLQMQESIAAGDWRLAFISRDRMEEVTPEMVADVAGKYFKPSNRTTGRFFPTPVPDRAEIPEVDDIDELVSGYEGREAIAEGEEFDPSFENINSRTVSGTIPGTDIKYNILPKETRGNSVIATMSMRFGDLKSLMGKSTIGDFTGSMLLMGSKDYTRQQIQDKLDELKARAFVNGGATNAFLRIETENEKLDDVIAFLGEVLRSPVFPQEELDKLKKERIASIDEGRSEPRVIASQQLSRRMNDYEKGHPYYTPTFDEQIEMVNAVTREDVVDFYNNFYGASGATFGASGDLDPKKVVSTLTETFGDWESKMPFTRIDREYRDVKGEEIKIETPDKANAMFLAAQVLPISDSHPDYPALVLGNYMLGGGFLNSRLATRIRGEDGLSYAVGSQFSASALDERGQFITYAMFAPENREALEKAFREVIESVRAEGFTQEELDAARGGWIQAQAVSRAQDGSMAGSLSNNAYLGRTMDWSKEMEAKVMALTPEQINAAVAKYIDLEKMMMVNAGDFAKSEGVKKP